MPIIRKIKDKYRGTAEAKHLFDKFSVCSMFLPVGHIDTNKRDGCECGAKYDRDFPDAHMFYCPLFAPRKK